MTPTFLNSSGAVDDGDTWKTYYLRVTFNGENFYKIGVCKGKVQARYRKESSDVAIHLLRLWTHQSETAAAKHESALFKQHTGDRPYIGRCGPFRFGGNTETFSHDVIGGEPPPPMYVAKLYALERCGVLATGYSKRNPLLSFRHLFGQVRYMDTMWGPPDFDNDVFLQVPLLSSSNTVVLATAAFLEDALLPERPSKPWFPKRAARDALERSITVRQWSDYADMKFEGKGFKVSKWDAWC